METAIVFLIVFVPTLLASFGLICFISAIFNQWAYRNVMPIKDPRRRRIVLIVTGSAFFIMTIVIVSILLSLRPNDQY